LGRDRPLITKSGKNAAAKTQARAAEGAAVKRACEREGAKPGGHTSLILSLRQGAGNEAAAAK
jgi:hypothetical protein